MNALPPLIADPPTTSRPHLGERLLIAGVLALIGITLAVVIWLQWQQNQWLNTIITQSSVDEAVGAQLQLMYEQGMWMLLLISAESLGIMVFISLIMWQIRQHRQQNQRLQLMTEALEQARVEAVEAVEANRSKGKFLANMSHEVRTPFQGLLGMLNLLESKLEHQEQREYLHNAYESADHLLGLINDILDISTLESGSLRLSPTPTHITSIMSEVESLMAIPAQNKNLTLSVGVEPPRTGEAAIPEWLMADPRRLRQIIYNLLSNAIKFTSQGSVSATFSRVGGTDDCYLFTVRDTGMGMDEDTLNQLFSRFWQADTSVRRRVGGSGLGLEISRNLARMMGGEITVASEPGVGSIFIVMLQLPAVDAVSQQEAENAPGKFFRSDVAVQPLQILVADDHPLNLKFMRLLLERMGHQSTLCTNGQTALSTLQRQRFDVVLLDYHMPIMDGLATSRAIRNLRHTSKIPSQTSPEQVKIILITADSLKETRQKATLAGVNMVILKPVLEPDIQRAFQRCGLFLDNLPPEPQGTTLAKPIADEPSSLAEHSSAPPPQSAPLVNQEQWAAVIQYLQADEAQKLIGDFFAEDGSASKLIAMMKQSLADTPPGTPVGNAKAIAHVAHQLKGASIMLGFDALSDHASALENAMREPAGSLNTEQLTQLTHSVSATKTQALHLLTK